MTYDEAEAFAKQWIDEWNAHDVDAVLAHFADDVEFRSPVIIQRLGKESGTVNGKDELGAYWRSALETMPDLRFELDGVCVGVGVLAISYRNQTGRACNEIAELGPDGKIVRGWGAYGPPVS